MTDHQPLHLLALAAHPDDFELTPQQVLFRIFGNGLNQNASGRETITRRGYIL